MKHYNDGICLLKTQLLFHMVLVNGLESSGLLDYCDVFISSLDSGFWTFWTLDSGGNHSLLRIK